MLKKSRKVVLVVTLLFSSITFAQSPISGFYAKKSELTVAPSYSFKSYNNFYRGAKLSDGTPANLGEITSSIINLYAEYGISDWLSTVVSIPYISVESEAGNLDPVQQKSQISGVQDLGLMFKARGFEKKFKNSSKLTLGAAAGISLPISDYEAAGVLSIGNRAVASDILGVFNYTTPFKIFAELQTGYSVRSSSDFEIPNAALHSIKVGYFNDWIYAHAKLGIQDSMSGMDIGTPEFAAAGGAMVLPETEVDYTLLSFDLYTPIYKNNLGLSAGYGRALNGRNFNSESSFSLALVYKAI